MKRLCCCLAVTLLGCATGSDPTNPVTVDLRTDFAAGVEFTTIRTTLAGQDPVVRSAALGERFQEWTQIAAFESGSGVLRVELVDASGRTISSREENVSGSLRSVPIVILRCDGCACSDAAECPALSDCSPALCDRGACFYDAQHDRCPTGVCEPMTGCSSTIPDADGDGVPATEDCDDGDDAVGRTGTRVCSDACGEGMETCADGTWGDCQVECTCEPGSVVTDSCGNCGTRVDTCGTDGTFTMGACVGEGPCAAGTIEQGAACGRCGTLQRTCGVACGWSEFSCVEPAGGCWMWTWDATTGWSAFDRPPAGTADAPTEAVTAAFDVEAAGEAYLLTATTYHVLRLSDRAWVESGALSSLLPGIVGAPISALTIPADHPMPTPDGREGLQVSTSVSRTYLYANTVGTRDWPSTGAPVPCCGDAWSSADAPVFLSVRAQWLDADDQHGWFETDPGTLCSAGAGVSPVPYLAYLEGADVHLLEAGACFVFAPQRPANMFGPFSTSGGPDPGRVNAAFYRESERQLWLITP
ncbi:MAG TPA: hypothetical protein ENK57_03445 [Polyangiaceae bacterium]|nr:hypothetical protein [Polyangiaceae bacterium]